MEHLDCFYLSADSYRYAMAREALFQMTCKSRLFGAQVEQMFHVMLPESLRAWASIMLMNSTTTVNGVCTPSNPFYPPAVDLGRWEAYLSASFKVEMEIQRTFWSTQRYSHIPFVPQGTALIVCVVDVNSDKGVCVLSRGATSGMMEATHLGVGDMALICHPEDSSVEMFARVGVRFCLACFYVMLRVHTQVEMLSEDEDEEELFEAPTTVVKRQRRKRHA